MDAWASSYEFNSWLNLNHSTRDAFFRGGHIETSLLMAPSSLDTALAKHEHEMVSSSGAAWSKRPF
ncbi:MAG: hypothetical protein JWR60_2501 [Polaromonas sp.]|nr:hypothetical protein [Polaromonas sp.]